LTITLPLAAAQKDTSDEPEKQVSMEVSESPKVSEDGTMSGTADVDSEQKQYSMQADEPHPKQRNNSSMNSSGSLTDSEETQYSLSDDDMNPKERNAKSMHGSESYDKKEHKYSEWDSQNPAYVTAKKPADLNDWRGMNLYSSDDEKIGEVSEVVIDLKTGEATHLLIDNPGIFSGSRLIAINEVHSSREENRVSANVSKKDFEMYPKYDDKSEYTVDRTGNNASYARNDDMAKKDRAMKSEKENTVNIPSNSVFCSYLVGVDVMTSEGNEIGQIDKLVQAPGTGETYAIIGDIDDDVKVDKDTKRIAIKVSSLKLTDKGMLADFYSRDLAKARPVNSNNRESWITSDANYILLGSEDSYALAD
jgi:sporulation protein YlmC with PRC-barrel domain